MCFKKMPKVKEDWSKILGWSPTSKAKNDSAFFPQHDSQLSFFKKAMWARGMFFFTVSA